MVNQGSGTDTSCAASGGNADTVPFLIPIFVILAVVATGVTIIAAAVLMNSSLSMGGLGDDAPGFSESRGTASLVPDSPWLVCYGECEYAGDIIYAGKSGATGEFLHVIYAMAGHEVDSIGTMKLGEETVPLDGSGNATGKYAGYIHVEKKLGAAGQTAFSIGIAEWNSNCKAQGRAVVWVRLKWNQELFPSGVSTIRLIRFLVKGRKVYDTRTATTAWSDNAELCIRDHCASADWGFKMAAGDFNETVMNAEANICDEAVSLLAGGSEARYTVNGVFRADEDPREILRAMVAACGGRCAFPAGKFAVYTAAWRGSSGPIGDDDMRQGGALTILPRRPRDVIANGVRGRYFGPETNWQSDDYVPYLVSTSEEGQRIFADLDQRFVRSNARCMRLAKIYLLRLRRQETVVIRGKLPLYQFLPPDVISLTHTNVGWNAKTFEVAEMSFALEKDDQGGIIPGIDISAAATDSAIFDWDYSTEEVAKTPSATPTAASALWIEPPDQFISASADGPFSYSAGGPSSGAMWIRWTWTAHDRYRNDESMITVAASSAATAPAAPTLGQVAGGALGGRTRYVRVAYVKELVMFHISTESNFALSANNLLKVTSPAAVAGYDGWIPLVGDTTNQERQQSGALPTAPTAFGTDWTEPSGGANVTTGTKYSDDNAQLGGHVWDLAASVTRYFYASYDYLNKFVEFTGGVLTAVSAQQAARQNRQNHYRLSEGAMSAATPAAGGGGSGGGGGGGAPCWSPESLVRTQRGLVPIAEVRPRVDYVCPKTGGWRLVARKLMHEYGGRLVLVRGVGLVTLDHRLVRDGEWRAAGNLYRESVEYKGLLCNLEVEAESFDERSYEMANDEQGNSVVAHNVLK